MHNSFYYDENYDDALSSVAAADFRQQLNMWASFVDVKRVFWTLSLAIFYTVWCGGKTTTKEEKEIAKKSIKSGIFQRPYTTFSIFKRGVCVCFLFRLLFLKKNFFIRSAATFSQVINWFLFPVFFSSLSQQPSLYIVRKLIFLILHSLFVCSLSEKNCAGKLFVYLLKIKERREKKSKSI